MGPVPSVLFYASMTTTVKTRDIMLFYVFWLSVRMSECHYIRHKYPHVLRDELMRVRWSKVMATVTSQHAFLAITH